MNDDDATLFGGPPPNVLSPNVPPPAGPAPPEAGPTVDPRFRRRWAEARRAEGRRRLRVLLGVLGALALMGAGLAVLHSPLLAVRHIKVVGNSHTPRAQVIAAAGLAGTKGQPLMVDVGSARAQRAVDALPWVASATFRRAWPWTVLVSVHERKAVALVRTGGVVDLVDATGRVLDAVGRSGTPPRLPVLTGASGAAPGGHIVPLPGTTGDALAQLLAAAASVPPGIARGGLVFVWSRGTGLVAYAGPERLEVLLGDASDAAYKFAVLSELGKAANLGEYSQVDLAVPQRPALTPRS